MKIGIIVQARMSAQRFPGKVLHKIAGKPLVQYLLERLKCCRHPSPIIVATSTEDSDTAIVNFCRELGVACYRGSLLNVAGRFNELLDIYPFDGFVRISADSPLLDQRLVDKGIEIFLKGNFDLVTNVLVRTYPKGQSIEILRCDTFRTAYQRMETAEVREHVTTYFYNHQDSFKIFNLESSQNNGQIQLSIDTPQDMDTFASIISKMDRPHWSYTLDEILYIYRNLADDLKKQHHHETA